MQVLAAGLPYLVPQNDSFIAFYTNLFFKFRTIIYYKQYNKRMNEKSRNKDFYFVFLGFRRYKKCL